MPFLHGAEKYFLIPYPWQNSVNGVPLSVTNSSGNPCWVKMFSTTLKVFGPFLLEPLWANLKKSRRWLDRWNMFFIVPAKLTWIRNPGSTWAFPEGELNFDCPRACQLTIVLSSDEAFNAGVDLWPTHVLSWQCFHPSSIRMSIMQSVVEIWCCRLLGITTRSRCMGGDIVCDAQFGHSQTQREKWVFTLNFRAVIVHKLPSCEYWMGQGWSLLQVVVVQFNV